jgi:hypothetical protein
VRWRASAASGFLFEILATRPGQPLYSLFPQPARPWSITDLGRDHAGSLPLVSATMPRLLRSSSAFSRWPQRRTFGELLDEFEAVSLAAKPRKRTTLIDYKATIRNHLRPEFGSEDLARLSRRPEAFERYAGEKIAAGLSPNRA